MSLRWTRIESPAERWRRLLEAVRDEQPNHPDEAAELFTGDHSTCYVYRRRLLAGLVPTNKSNTPIGMDLSGFGFFVKNRPNGRGTLYAVYLAGEQLSFTEPVTPMTTSNHGGNHGH